MLNAVEVKTATDAPLTQNAENFDLRDILLVGRRLNLKDRVSFFRNFLEQRRATNEYLMCREVVSTADREVYVIERGTGATRPMLMFGSNNYLGFAGHPHVRETVKRIVDEFGAGIGGPPLLNGYTSLHREVERRLAKLKGTEDAMIFSSGYGANVGIATGLFTTGDMVLYDAYCHASFYDGLKLTCARSHPFRHNDMADLSRLLQLNAASGKDVFIAVEGVYSMDGDTAPLAEIVELARQYNAYVIVDDAHGLGVLGTYGAGTADAFCVHEEVDISMGTFSKSLAVAGGFVCGRADIIEHLRFFARSYMFSASVPPPVLGAVLAGLDLLEQQPQLIERLHTNVDYALTQLRKIGLDARTSSAIIPIRVPEGMNIRKAAFALDQEGIFVNSVEYPAVPAREERFRISIMATHTLADIDRLAHAFKRVWDRYYAGELRTTGY